MRAPVQRSQFIGLLEADGSAVDALAFADAVLGAASAERLQLIACAGSAVEATPCEPCVGDEMAVLAYERSQQSVASVARFHGERLSGRRPLTGLGGSVVEGIAGQVVTLGGEVLVAARGPVLEGETLASAVGRSQLPSCVVAAGFGGSIRKIAVAVDFQEGSALLMERALVLASQFGVELVPVHVSRPEVPGERRPAGGAEAKRFEQLMGQVELAFGAAYATRNLLQPLELVRGEAVEALQTWASTAPVDLVVVGSGAPGRPWLSLGSVATALVGSFPVALWIEPLADRATS